LEQPLPIRPYDIDFADIIGNSHSSAGSRGLPARAEFPAIPDETGISPNLPLKPCFRCKNGGPYQSVANKFPLPPKTEIFAA
jgi:hypothetical protein